MKRRRTSYSSEVLFSWFSAKRVAAILGGATLVIILAFSLSSRLNTFWNKHGLTKEKLALLWGDRAVFQRFPQELEIPVEGQDKPLRARVTYAFDAKLQQEMEGLFKSYSPDYGAFVAVDARTGRVLSMVSYSKNPDVKDHLALRATFPSASVFKVVTAAAAIEGKNFSAETVVAYNGSNHTLYRSNILKNKITRWTRYTTLKEAFARSINTVFGRIGAFNVGSQELREYAGRFGFNRAIAADMPVQKGQAIIPEDAWGLAESASGFTRENTMSPLQGSLIAAAIVNDGQMMEPYIVQTIQAIPSEGDNAEVATPLYEASTRPAAHVIDAKTAAEIRSLMRETITRGTSRGSFRRFFKKDFAGFDVGGKTGSLTGKNPRGKYDWFVGYAQDPQGRNRIALAALTVHEKYWRVKSSYLARRAIESYFKDVDRIPAK